MLEFKDKNKTCLKCIHVRMCPNLKQVWKKSLKVVKKPHNPLDTGYIRTKLSDILSQYCNYYKQES